MPLTGLSKGAFRKGAPFALLVLLLSIPLRAAATCPADHIDEQARVHKIYDGDTVQLQDGRKLRFIGINAPEIGYDGKPSEPYADQAKQFLKQLLSDNPLIALRYDREQRDHYGRLLAHPYLPDGRSINVLMLAEGLAARIVVPPNSWSSHCYAVVEKSARSADKGIWQTGRFRAQPSRDLPLSSRGFYRVQGKVVRVGSSRKSLWLNLEGNVVLRIPRKDLDNFNGYPLQHLEGKRVVVQGWLNYHKSKLVITIRHPASLEITEQK
jgi:micrococcal nuclease